MTEGLMNKVEKKLDVLCLGAAVVDIPLRPVSREVFDIESYPVDNIAMAVGGDAMNESTIISRLGFKTGLMAAIGDDAAGAFIFQNDLQKHPALFGYSAATLL